jgi:hypothetical protein
MFIYNTEMYMYYVGLYTHDIHVYLQHWNDVDTFLIHYHCHNHWIDLTLSLCLCACFLIVFAVYFNLYFCIIKYVFSSRIDSVYHKNKGVEVLS